MRSGNIDRMRMPEKPAFSSVRIAARIRESRIVSGATHREVAAYLGIRDYIYKDIENGVRPPKLKELFEIAWFINTSVDYLLFGLVD